MDYRYQVWHPQRSIDPETACHWGNREIFCHRGTTYYGAGRFYGIEYDAADKIIDLTGSLMALNDNRVITMFIGGGKSPHIRSLKEWQRFMDQFIGIDRVLVCCLGGHGRTGSVLAAMAMAAGKLTRGDDPNEWIRKRLCTRAIESQDQEDYLERLHINSRKG